MTLCHNSTSVHYHGMMKYSFRKDADWWHHHLSRDPCQFYRPKIIFADINKTWKMMPSSNLLLPSGFTCESFKFISPLDPKICNGPYFCLYTLVCNFWSPWKIKHCRMIRGHMRGKCFMGITQVVLKSYRLSRECIPPPSRVIG